MLASVTPLGGHPREPAASLPPPLAAAAVGVSPPHLSWRPSRGRTRSERPMWHPHIWPGGPWGRSPPVETAEWSDVRGAVERPLLPSPLATSRAPRGPCRGGHPPWGCLAPHAAARQRRGRLCRHRLPIKATRTRGRHPRPRPHPEHILRGKRHLQISPLDGQ